LDNQQSSPITDLHLICTTFSSVHQSKANVKVSKVERPQPQNGQDDVDSMVD
jgi:hypothetical protein